MNPASVSRIATALILIIVVLAGGIITIIHPDTLPFAAYVKDVATAVGLLAVGYGLDAHSRP